MNKLAIKWTIILAAIFGAVALLWPSYEWYSKTPQEREKLEASGDRPKRILNLGLDLRGGSSLLLELDVSKLSGKESLNDSMQRAIEIVRNRIDQYGVGEIPITRQGEKWISVQLPGIANPEQAEALIGKTAMLEFRIVKDDAAAQEAVNKLNELDNPFNADGTLTEEAAKLVPAGITVMKDKQGFLVALTDTAAVTGADLEDARVTTGEYGYPAVSFQFNGEGAKKFGNLTGANLKKDLAIVLDNTVQSAPTINARITRDGQITGQFTMEEARQLAIVLRAGALPAPVNIIEKRIIGPGLGEDSIKSGVKASLVGFVFIVLFMSIYYRFSGVISSIALLLNLVFLLALMAYFSATLTLPGIAGIILSLAMAVDANVLILERMREEKDKGQPLPIIIKEGYDKAWSAIFDSNLTTWIASLLLFQFGTGPVKGFALTLTLGLFVGVFTSVFVTRAIYELLLTANPKEISI
ncbi:protein translocase subunit SecD [Candidatus Proelusimicrobium excrementi]|uniref:protein translocase subunit SecD n=1 Tax=Candidatus Proelusimicrobium excrementi TaxID=3416222 RepID=UPI003CB48300|nr:protein translocase subunit SecD [Elusimicrobiaceae bacterium]